MNPFDRAPAPPDYALDWDALEAGCDWLEALRGCPQDPRHHAEGDVAIHTRMVVSTLASLPAFRALGDDERRIVFAAALLHDVAKPACTRTGPDGITARGHSLRGAVMARQILWRAGVPFLAREQVCNVIRYHQVPFFLLERDDPRRLLYAVSQAARCDLLALCTEADGRGRRCVDQQRLIDNVELFRAYADEHGCLAAPRAFPSAHARFHYFVNEGRDPDYRPHEQFRCEVVLLSGLPGAGKDHFVRTNLSDWPVVSLDDLRRELDVDPADAQGAVVQAAREAARTHLRAGRRLVWNATNLSRQLRGQCIRLFADYGARVRIVYLEVDPARLYRQNRERASPVPESVIERLLDRWEVPDATEAHEVDYRIAPY
jgi:putative nucleotidyltransferase with HDIG domain